MKKCYLAGPITGLSYAECTAWRDEVSVALLRDGIDCFSPMRFKQYLAGEQVIDHTYPREVMSCQRGIMTRDHHDVITADCVLVNLLGCTPAGTNRVTVGTVQEMAWAWDRRIPVVCVMEPSGNVHDHPMVRETIGFRVETLDQAVQVVRSILVSGNAAAAAEREAEMYRRWRADCESHGPAVPVYGPGLRP